MKRRIKRTTSYLVEVPSWDVETEILFAIDARRKLQAAIESENRQRETAEINFARSVVQEISSSQVVNVDLVFQRDVTAKAAAERSQDRIEALQSVLARVNKRIEQLKSDSADAVNAALTKKTEALEKTISEKAGTRKEIEEEINLWKAEIIVKPPKATVKKATAPGATS